MSYLLSEADKRILGQVVDWYKRHKNDPPNWRGRPIITGGGGSEIRRAKLTADAGSGNTITANLYNNAGEEQTTGDESGVTVYCLFNHSSSNSLSAAIPRLYNGQDITVTKLAYINGEEVEQRWYCTTIFQKIGDLLAVDASGNLYVDLVQCT